MKKQTFKKGDRVFHYLKGWGEIVHTYSDNWEEVDDNYTICVVKFDSSKEIVHFTKYLATKTLSFTEYKLQGFTQEKPVNYKDYVGKWGKFWDTAYKNTVIIAKLSSYLLGDGYRSFRCYTYGEDSDMGYNNFEPLTEEQVKILNLE